MNPEILELEALIDELVAALEEALDSGIPVSDEMMDQVAEELEYLPQV